MSQKNRRAMNHQQNRPFNPNIALDGCLSNTMVLAVPVPNVALSSCLALLNVQSSVANLSTTPCNIVVWVVRTIFGGGEERSHITLIISSDGRTAMHIARGF